MKIKLKIEILEKLQNEKKWTDTELSKQMGISRSRLWRAKLPETHEEYCSPGESFILGTMLAFPEKKFEDLFFLKRVCSRLNEKVTA